MARKKWKAVFEIIKKRKKTSVALAAVLLVFILALAGRGTQAAQGGEGKPGAPGMGAGQIDHMASVRAEQPGIGDIELTTALTGTVEPSDVVHLYAKAGGEITSVEVKAGETVQAGQLICVVDTDQVESAKNSMDSAAVALSEAQSTLNRMQLLYSGGDISDQEWEQYQNKVKTARLQYDSARLAYEKQVEYSSVTAPISGRVESCDIEVYDTVGQNTELCVISGEGDKRVSFYVTEPVMENLSLGDAIEVEKNGKQYEGTISDISSMADEATGLFKVKAELPEVNSIATGSVVKIYVVSGRAVQVMTVPVDAVYFDGGAGNVYVYEDGVIHKKEVEVGLYDSELAEIKSGLQEGELVVSTWSSELYEGSSVKLKGEEEESAGTQENGADPGEAGGESQAGIDSSGSTPQSGAGEPQAGERIGGGKPRPGAAAAEPENSAPQAEN